MTQRAKDRIFRRSLPLPELIKETLRNQRFIQESWGALRRWQLHHQYASRREYYHRLALAHGLVYREAEVVDSVRTRLSNRGYSPKLQKEGEVHTFAFVPSESWHTHLLPDLKELGPLTVFDYTKFGYRLPDFHKFGKKTMQRRKEMNALVVPALRTANEKTPVDWVFVYATGREISSSTLHQITDQFGVPTVNMCLDDKQSWAGPFMGDHRAGQIDIASSFDLSWTSARVACEWYLVEGARPIYMPEGFNIEAYRPMDVEQDIPVSFIGKAYGFRRSVVRFLERHRIPIRPFGPGWGTESVWGEDQVKVLNRSIINLGMGGIGYSEGLTNVKTRDFEIPAVGRGVYLTSYNSDLAQHFVIGEEILCYRHLDEMLELIRYYLAHPEEAESIAKRGRKRCIAEHRWLHRYRRVCRILGIFPNEHR